MSHTPGPWKNLENRITSSGGEICEIFALEGDDRHSKYEEANANARLIAAAPELLQILQSIVEDVGYGGGGALLCDQFLSRARAVIAKAEGGGT